ncbi:MAG: hypothetical protein C0449_17150 [Polaromonas sp.]|nr:hypothetical protein [Polaromonas sp.]
MSLLEADGTVITQDMAPHTQCTTLAPPVTTSVGAEHWQAGADMMFCARAGAARNGSASAHTESRDMQEAMKFSLVQQRHHQRWHSCYAAPTPL